MVNGFAVVTRLLLSPVGRAIRRPDPPPLLQPHYRPSSLLQGGPSQCSASVVSPRGLCRLCFSLGIGTTGSRSSAREPGSESRPLYAGRRPPNHQAPGELVPGDGNAPGFDGKSLDYDASSRIHFRSSLLIPTCLGYVPNALTPMLTTTALYRSSLGWFEARSWKPTPKGLSFISHAALTQSVSSSRRTSFLRAPAAHFQCPSGHEWRRRQVLRRWGDWTNRKRSRSTF
jgi:hypothetical protein